MHSAFMAAVAASPNSLLPNLVFADWLDDTGHEAYAEFVRIECRLASAPLGLYERKELSKRADKLFRACERYWAEVVGQATGYSPSESGFEYECGVLRSVSASLMRMDAPRLFDLVPIRRFKLNVPCQFDGYSPAVVSTALRQTIPLMGAVEGITIETGNLTRDDAAELLSLPRLTSWLDGGLLDSDSLGLLADTTFRRRAISVTTKLTSADSLPAVGRLCESGTLRSLELRAYRQDTDVLGSACVATLVGARCGWERLGLTGLLLNDGHLADLLTRHDLSHATSLSIGGNRISTLGYRVLTAANLAALNAVWCDDPRLLLEELGDARATAHQAGREPPLPSLAKVGRKDYFDQPITLHPPRPLPLPPGTTIRQCSVPRRGVLRGD